MNKHRFQDLCYFVVEPLFIRKTRSKLTQVAHRASIEVFATNLKNLLLSPPLKNTNVVGLDPGNLRGRNTWKIWSVQPLCSGFKHGCKCAAVSADGSVLHTETIYIRFGESAEKQAAARTLRHMIQHFKFVELINSHLFSLWTLINW